VQVPKSAGAEKKASVEGEVGHRSNCSERCPTEKRERGNEENRSVAIDHWVLVTRSRTDLGERGIGEGETREIRTHHFRGVFLHRLSYLFRVLSARFYLEVAGGKGEGGAKGGNISHRIWWVVLF